MSETTVAPDQAQATVQITAAPDAVQRVESSQVVSSSGHLTTKGPIVILIKGSDDSYLPPAVTANKEIAPLLKRGSIGGRLTAQSKQALLDFYGGTPESEAAVLRGLAWLAAHPVWGVIALPLRSMLYVREINVPKLAEKYGWEFRTKHQLCVELLTWFKQLIRVLGVEAKLWLAVDGAYAVRPFLLPVLDLDFVVVSRLRKDACLFDLPAAGSHGNRIYGKHKISLAKRAAHRKGWTTISYDCCGEEVTRQYKTFLATSQLVSGQIRVVIVRFEDRRIRAS